MPDDTSVQDFITLLLKETPKARSKANGKAKKKSLPLSQIKINPTLTRLARFDSKNWRDEAVVLLVTRATCQGCGTLHTTPHSFPYLRRYHPNYGVHEEALGVRRISSIEVQSLPNRIEWRDIDIPCCQACFSTVLPQLTGQGCFDFTEGDKANGTPIQLGDST